MQVIAVSGAAHELATMIPLLLSSQSAIEHVSATLREGVQLDTAVARAAPLKRHVALNAAGFEVDFNSKDFVLLEDRHAGLLFDLRCIHRGNWSSCDQFARSSNLLDRKWRLGTVEELFVNVASRAHFNPAVDRNLLPMLKSEWVWSSTPDVDDDPASPVCAWGVDLHYGDAGINYRSAEGLALPVSSLGVSPGQ